MATKKKQTAKNAGPAKPTKRKAGALRFATVCAFPRNLAALGGHLLHQGAEPTGTRVMICANGAWTHLADVPEVIHAMRIAPAQATLPKRLALLGTDGIGKSGLYWEFISGQKEHRDASLEDTEVGYLEDLRAIGDHVFACGAQGQVYRFDGARWAAADRGLRVPFAGEVERILTSITGFSEDDVYVCGWEPDRAWRWDGKRWTRLAPPTKHNLECALAGPDGAVYFGGDGGTLLALRPDGTWRDLSPRGAGKATFGAMTTFRGRVHVASEERLFVVEGDALAPIADPPEGTWSFQAIDAAADDRIWCVGGEETFTWDGERWTRFLCPENQ